MAEEDEQHEDNEEDEQHILRAEITSKSEKFDSQMYYLPTVRRCVLPLSWKVKFTQI